jgi:hypothetical protein
LDAERHNPSGIGVSLSVACGCTLAAYLGLWQLLGNSPRTVAFEIESWENNSWGLHNIEMEQASGTVAVSADGSRANKVNWTHLRHYFIQSAQGPVHSIYRRPENIAYQVDDQARTTTILPCTCTGKNHLQCHLIETAAQSPTSGWVMPSTLEGALWQGFP